MRKFHLIIVALFITASSFGQTKFSGEFKIEKNLNPNLKSTNVYTEIFSEDFSGGIPSSFTLHNVDGLTPNSNVSGITNAWVASGGVAVSTSWYTPAGISDDWMVTPAISISGVNPYLVFDVQAPDVDYRDSLIVYISTTGTDVSDFTASPIYAEKGPTEITTMLFDLSSYDGQDIYIAFRNHSNDMYILKVDNIVVANLKQTDVALVKEFMPQVIDVNDNAECVGLIKNVGLDVISSFDIDYTIDGSTTTYSVTGQNIGFGKTYVFTHGTPHQLTAAGAYPYTINITNVNGGVDSDPTDNIISKSVYAANENVNRKIVVEQFTTEECPNCPPVLAYMEGIYENDSNILMMTHHAGYYTDFLTIQEHIDMLEFFNDGGSTFAPAGMFDRSYNRLDNDDDGNNEPGPVFWDGSPYGQTRITSRLVAKSYVSVNISKTYNHTTRQLDVNVSGEFKGGMENMGVSLWIVEDHIAQQSQASAPTGFEHRYTSRDVVSNLLGDAISTSSYGDTYSVDYNLTLNSAWNDENVYVYAVVSELNTSDVNQREIANANRLKIYSPATLVNSIENSSINILPNPSTGIINVKGSENSTIEVLNSLGQVVAVVENATNFQSINLSENNAGTYIVRIKTNDSIIVKKVNLVK